jgi:hypothetical protein
MSNHYRLVLETPNANLVHGAAQRTAARPRVVSRLAQCYGLTLFVSNARRLAGFRP